MYREKGIRNINIDLIIISKTFFDLRFFNDENVIEKKSICIDESNSVSENSPFVLVTKY